MTITLRQICLVAEDLAARVSDFEVVFGLKVCFVDEASASSALKMRFCPSAPTCWKLSRR